MPCALRRAAWGAELTASIALDAVEVTAPAAPDAADETVSAALDAADDTRSAVAEAASGLYSGFLRKPFKLHAVIEVINRVLNAAG